jgi:hypothetical protein
MPQGRMLVRIEGGSEALRAARAVPGVEVFAPGPLEGGGYALFAELGPEERKRVEATGARVIVVENAEQYDAYLAECAARGEPAMPVALVALIGPPGILGNLPAKFGIDPPVYSARPLEGGAWEISTQAREEHIAAFRKAGLEVRILETAEALSRLRGQ